MAVLLCVSANDTLVSSEALQSNRAEDIGLPALPLHIIFIQFNLLRPIQ